MSSTFGNVLLSVAENAQTAETKPTLFAPLGQYALMRDAFTQLVRSENECLGLSDRNAFGFLVSM